MKKIAYILMLAGLVGQLAAHAQTDAASTNAPADSSTNPPAVTFAGTNAMPVVSTNDMSTAAVSNAAPAMATSDTNSAATAATTTGTNAAPADAAPGSIPLIQFSDVPITTAIENLARQAGINYMMDPHIGYNQPDANGQMKAEPQLSIRWENITAENALVALLDNYNLQLVRDKKTGIDRITMKDPTAPPVLITRVIQLQYAGVSNLVEAVQSTFTDKRSRVIGDVRTSQMVIVATESEQTAVDTLIKQLDTPTKQVLIETELVEISSQPSTKKGVDWSATLSGQNVAFGNGALSGSTTVNSPGSASSSGSTPGGGYSTPPASSSAQTALTLLEGNGGFAASTLSGLIPSTGFLTADGVKAVISFLNATYNAQVMSTPRIVTLDNQAAEIDVTRQVPIINFSGGTQQTAGSSSITYSNVGTVLKVLPRISANQKIWLQVTPEVSSKFGDVTITIPGGQGNASTSFPVPIFDVRRLQTQVLIPNGNTLVMGGLVQDAPTASYTKVPLLGDIPGLGWGFRSENKTMSKDNLIIFMTPTIVQDTDFHASPSTFLETKAQTMKSPMDPHEMWDGGQPRGNWDNPAPLPGEFENKPKMHDL